MTRGVPTAQADAVERRLADNPALHAVSMLELMYFVGERLLRDIDATSMAVSLEVRVPLLDHVVIETAARLDETERFMPLGQKAVLRAAALESIDPAVFDRPKSGFVLPIDVWARSTLKEKIGDVFGDERLVASLGLDQRAISRLWEGFCDGVPGIHWSRIWSLFVLLWWCREHNVCMACEE